MRVTSRLIFSASYFDTLFPVSIVIQSAQNNDERCIKWKPADGCGWQFSIVYRCEMSTKKKKNKKKRPRERGEENGIGQVFAGRQQEVQEKVGVVRLVCQPPSYIFNCFSLLYSHWHGDIPSFLLLFTLGFQLSIETAADQQVPTHYERHVFFGVNDCTHSWVNPVRPRTYKHNNKLYGSRSLAGYSFCVRCSHAG